MFKVVPAATKQSTTSRDGEIAFTLPPVPWPVAPTKQTKTSRDGEIVPPVPVPNPQTPSIHQPSRLPFSTRPPNDTWTTTRRPTTRYPITTLSKTTKLWTKAPTSSRSPTPSYNETHFSTLFLQTPDKENQTSKYFNCQPN